jgi:cytoskeletal protein CcmA (bactofilin family)
MLGKTKKPENDTSYTVTKKEENKPAPPPPRPTANANATATPTSTATATATATPAPTPTPSEEKTIIGEHISIEGQIKGREHLVIEGEMKGNVEMEKHNFTVGSNGRVDGEIRAQNVSISGLLKGAINAVGKVDVTKEADFLGDIKANSISVEDGAYFKGSIELNREPHRKTSFPEAARAGSAPGKGQTAFSPGTDAKKES